MQISSSIGTTGIASAFVVLIQNCHRNPRVGLTTNFNLRIESITTPLGVSLLSESVATSKATSGRQNESQPVSSHSPSLELTGLLRMAQLVLELSAS